MTQGGISMDAAALVSTILETLLFGFSLVLYGWTMWVLVYKRSRLRINYKMVTIACLLFVLSTAHLAIDLHRQVKAFIFVRDSFPGGPVAFFSDFSRWSFVSKNAIYTLQTLLGDGVVIYRCHAVWRTWKVLLVPVLLWCGVAASGIGSLATSGLAYTGSSVLDAIVGKWITLFYGLTIITNLLSTGLLAYKLWTTDRRTASIRTSRSHLRPILRVVLDAGMIYSVTLLAAFSCYLAESNGEFVVLDMISPIISITFYMAIIRIGMVQADRGGTTSYALGCTSSSINRREDNRILSQRSMMQVHITTLTECKGDGPQVMEEESDTADTKTMKADRV
ncbi:hypothetical protein HYDPIDRAFT_94799 [Hydnomerulius pinastri MD-312]|uniref:Uncharacterized protein n=1 Tax=Hydnomerulius pinastri MD-312 TaxID=994086 RepID=A0A0C9WCP3_9AGAM|nr:hypothetical protein HYDPIDRAFT_94799 [Hydnomerulius pinastri MD-312]